MGIRTYKPTSPGRRSSSVSDFAELTDKNKRPEKKLTEPLKKSGGRNNQGVITARHRGGGHKRKYRIIDFRRNDHDGKPAEVTHIEYDPNRSARIALIVYPDGEKRYILAPDGLKAGDERLQRTGLRTQAGQLPAAGQDPHRTFDPQHRDAARRWGQALPIGGGGERS